MVLKYIIVDDEEIYRDSISLILSPLEGIECIGQYGNPHDARNMINALNPDFVLLDVEMPGLNGFQMVKSLLKPPKVIFITSYINYAVEAFDVQAIDYVVKPINPVRLLRAIDKIKEMFQEEYHQVLTIDNAAQKDYFFIKDGNKYIKLKNKEILYIISMGNYAEFYMINGAKKITLVSMNQLEDQLPLGLFCRISRSTIVNIEHVDSIIGNKNIVINNTSLNIGQAFSENALEMILNHTIKRL